MRKIIVGTDGSESAAVAMRWAAEEAEIHGASIQAVLAWSYLDQFHLDRADTFDPDYTDETALAELASWVDQTLGSGARIEQHAVCDLPARALLEASDDADLMVLGARGRNGFEGLLLGSVSERVAQLASRPVAVVRGPADVRGGRVVVGIDGSARARGALRWAAAEARARDADLEVVHAWRMPMVSASPVVAALPDLTSFEAGGRAVLDDALADETLDGVRVHAYLSQERPTQAVLARAAGAGLVVAGTRGLGRVGGAVLGSVSRQLLQHAPCPVVVI